MILNGASLYKAAPIKHMASGKVKENGYSWGLSEAGYDIRIKQDILFDGRSGCAVQKDGSWSDGRFCLASAIEEFQMPPNLIGVVHDKSTWARQGLSVFNTVIEPGFHGGLTLELVYHGIGKLHIHAGTGIAQVLFHLITEEASYNGKYQNQSGDPEPARFE